VVALGAALLWGALRQPEREPRDGRGWALQAYVELEAERYAEAAAAFEKAVAASRKVAGDAGVWCDWADALAMAQAGSLAGRPTELIARALTLRPGHPKALEMAGSAAYERRDFASAASYWRQLLPQLADGSQAQEALKAAIARAERLAAVSLPPAR
jgi:cytochrome c-type biogenesis protein CcmH